MGYAHRVDGSAEIRLEDFDPNEDGGLEKQEGQALHEKLAKELGELEDLLYYAGQHSLLVIFQAMDAGGKDGAIRSVLGCCNVQSVRSVAFKPPTEEELAHDFLWRVHLRTPRKGEVILFNRSHYEDVVVARVRSLVPEEVWSRRFEHINHFESLLADSGTLILKFFLHISKEEQEERLLEREQETEKAWKLAVSDWQERELWGEYQAAYQDAINRCSRPHAPWYIVPANRKWFRNLAVLERIVETLRPLRAGWMETLERIGVEAKKELDAYRAGQG